MNKLDRIKDIPASHHILVQRIIETAHMSGAGSWPLMNLNLLRRLSCPQGQY